jgi:hypothetical protein
MVHFSWNQAALLLKKLTSDAMLSVGDTEEPLVTAQPLPMLMCLITYKVRRFVIIGLSAPN